MLAGRRKLLTISRSRLYKLFSSQEAKQQTNRSGLRVLGGVAVACSLIGLGYYWRSAVHKTEEAIGELDSEAEVTKGELEKQKQLESVKNSENSEINNEKAIEESKTDNLEGEKAKPLIIECLEEVIPGVRVHQIEEPNFSNDQHQVLLLIPPQEEKILLQAMAAIVQDYCYLLTGVDKTQPDDEKLSIQ